METGGSERPYVESYLRFVLDTQYLVLSRHTSLLSSSTYYEICHDIHEFAVRRGFSP
jgi:hypothetical protein